MRDRQVFEIHQLANGMSVYHYPSDQPYVVIRLRIPFGSAHNTGEILPGTAHFFEHMMFRETARLKDGETLVIGGLIDEQVLKVMLKEGRLAGAAFDVFAEEPPVDLELAKLPNFIATPHIGGAAEEAALAMGRAAINGLEDNQIPEPGVYPEGY